jgi:superfamily II RNA helicase
MPVLPASAHVALRGSMPAFAVQVKQLGKSIFEGSIVRAIRRLHELMLQMKTACEVLGDTDLADRMEEGAQKLKRDVVFAASLYL